MTGDEIEGQLAAAVDAIRGALGEDLAGVYLYGSATSGGLRPDSDLDLLVTARRPLPTGSKAAVVDRLRPISRPGQRPGGWRPVEASVVAESTVRPWRYPPRLELQYREWLTDDDLATLVASPAVEHADLAVLITMVRGSGRALVGPPPAAAFERVPRTDLARAMLDSLEPLLADLAGDTRNVLLTLARMWSTLETGVIKPKDEAADWAIDRLSGPHRLLLARARDLYRQAAGATGPMRPTRSRSWPPAWPTRSGGPRAPRLGLNPARQGAGTHRREMSDAFDLLAFALVQVLLVGLAAALALGPRGRSSDWIVLAGSGLILTGVNVAWLVAGGSTPALGGGLVGSWLSLVIALEVVLLGMLSFLRYRAG